MSLHFPVNTFHYQLHSLDSGAYWILAMPPFENSGFGGRCAEGDESKCGENVV